VAERRLVFVSGALPGEAEALLRAVHEVVQDDAGTASAAFSACAGRAEALVALLTDPIDGGLLARTPRLRVVANVAVGVDNVDLAACRQREVTVTNTPDVLTDATADLAFGLLLAAARRIAEGDRLVRAGGWSGWTLSFMLGARVSGSTLGVLGMGRIGQAVARRARGFAMTILYHQRSRLPEALERELGATFVSLDDLLAQSDAVTVHCPLTADTRHLLDARRLGAMRPGSILVNTARGPIVDEAALAEALERGPVAAAGLDVFESEPRVHPALLSRPDVVLTPHIGSAERPTRAAMAELAARNVLEVLAGRPPLTPVG